MKRFVGGLVLMVILGLCLAGPVGAVDATSSLVVNEVELNPAGRDAGREWIEIVNESDAAIDLAGWTVSYAYPSEGWILLSETSVLLGPGEIYVFTYPKLMLRNADNMIIELRDPDGNSVYRTSILNDEDNDGQTWQRFDLGADPLFGDLWVLADGTRGNQNEFELDSPGQG
jgi:hypothetical protein